MSASFTLAAATAMGGTRDQQVQGAGRPRSNSVGGAPTGGPLQGLRPRHAQGGAGYQPPVLVDPQGRPLSMTSPMAQSGFLGSSMFVHTGAPMVTQTPGIVIPATTNPYQYLASVVPAYSHHVNEMARLVDKNNLASVWNFWVNADAVDAAICVLPDDHPCREPAERALNEICLPKVRQTENLMQKLSDEVDCNITAKKFLAGIAAILCFVAGLGLLAGIFTFCAPAIFVCLLAVGLTAGVGLWAYGSAQEDKHKQNVCGFFEEKQDMLAALHESQQPRRHGVPAAAQPHDDPPPSAAPTAPQADASVAVQPQQVGGEAPAPAAASSSQSLPPPSDPAGDAAHTSA